VNTYHTEHLALCPERRQKGTQQLDRASVREASYLVKTSSVWIVKGKVGADGAEEGKCYDRAGEKHRRGSVREGVATEAASYILLE